MYKVLVNINRRNPKMRTFYRRMQTWFPQVVHPKPGEYVTESETIANTIVGLAMIYNLNVEKREI